MEIAIQSILEKFGIVGNIKFEEFDSGLINRSFHVIEKGNQEYVLQRINKEVFAESEKLMLNILIAHDELRKHPNYRVPEILFAKEGKSIHTDAEGYGWRLMEYIPNSVTYNSTDSKEVAFEVGKILGKFHIGTSECDLDRMHFTIADFHNLNFRVEWFLQSLQKADQTRLTNAFDCIQDVEEMIDHFRMMDDFQLPLRVTHNDTKLNNILFDKSTKKALCLIDLDTVMPGYLMHDFGDAVRTLCNPVEEGDANDLDDVAFNFTLFEAFLEGYVSEAGQLLTEEEWKSLPISLEYMSFIMAVRFLTDYLFEDKYYKIDFPDQNLIRCQNQLRYLEEIQKRSSDIERTIALAKQAIA